MTGSLRRGDNGSLVAWYERAQCLCPQNRFLGGSIGGLRLKGLCTPSYSLTLQARDAWQQQRLVAAPGRKRDVTPVRGNCSQAPGSKPLGWSFCTRGHTYPGLLEESPFQHGQRGGHGGQAGQEKDQLSPAATTAAYPMCKKQEHGSLCPRAMASSTVLSAQRGREQKVQQL